MTREIHRFESIDSTMHEAERRARAGCASGTAVVAREQTAGLGRLGRQWHSEPGSGLYVSVVLRLPAGVVPSITLALGLAGADAIRQVAELAPDLRWPNDLLIGDRKVGGILTELHHGAVIAGVGINVNHTSLPQDLRTAATSLRIESGREFSLDVLLDALLAAIDRRTDDLASEGRGRTIRDFTAASSYVSGRRVIVDQPDQHLEGITDGLDDDGFLWIRTRDGRRERVLAGGVRPAS